MNKGVHVVFDGYTCQVELSQVSRKNMCGLCGQTDSDEFRTRDFTNTEEFYGQDEDTEYPEDKDFDDDYTCSNKRQWWGSDDRTCQKTDANGVTINRNVTTANLIMTAHTTPGKILNGPAISRMNTNLNTNADSANPNTNLSKVNSTPNTNHSTVNSNPNTNHSNPDSTAGKTPNGFMNDRKNMKLTLINRPVVKNASF